MKSASIRFKRSKKQHFFTRHKSTVVFIPARIYGGQKFRQVKKHIRYKHGRKFHPWLLNIKISTLAQEVPKPTLLKASLKEGEGGHTIHVLFDAVFPLESATRQISGLTQCSCSHVLNSSCLEIFTYFFNW